MDLKNHSTFRVAASDLNGQMRGKRVPASYAQKLDSGAVRMPLSALNVDLWGADIEDSPLVFETGDADGTLRPSGRGPVPMPWLSNPSALVPMTMEVAPSVPFEGDPRNALERVLNRFDARGWKVMAATEMEFTLIDDSGPSPSAPTNPVTDRPLSSAAVLSVAQLDAFDSFFTELYEACAAMDIPAQTATSEAGLGQFEITLNHQDAMRAADDAWLFKVLARGMARKNGFAATFMAKPYRDDAGNGMHLHFSVVDDKGQNVFSNGGPEGSNLLRQAVAGCLLAMPASTLIFAPHGNSYERLVPGAHAPTSAAWAYENRTAAIRIPSGSASARRIEHRVAGGDINPYMMLAVVLGAAMNGMETGAEPPAPITGNAYDYPDLPQLAPDWVTAIDLFESDPVVADIFHPQLIANLVMTKRQEIRRMADVPADQRWLATLERV
ncbi:MAG: glutamine synthetase family protein [Paracoccaceae bacterium]